MITELDSVLLDVPNLGEAKAAYSRLFNSSAPHPSYTSDSRDGPPIPGCCFAWTTSTARPGQSLGAGSR